MSTIPQQSGKAKLVILTEEYLEKDKELKIKLKQMKVEKEKLLNEKKEKEKLLITLLKESKMNVLKNGNHKIILKEIDAKKPITLKLIRLALEQSELKQDTITDILELIEDERQKKKYDLELVENVLKEMFINSPMASALMRALEIRYKKYLKESSSSKDEKDVVKKSKYYLNNTFIRAVFKETKMIADKKIDEILQAIESKRSDGEKINFLIPRLSKEKTINV